MIKAVFFDIDGTLVTNEAKALPSTKESIEKLKKQGLLCGIATGRGPYKLTEHIDDLKMDVYVTYNGQYVYTNKTVLYANSFDKEVVKKIAVFADENNRQLLFGSSNKLEGSSMMEFGQKAWAKRLMKFLPKGKSISGFKKVMQKVVKARNKREYASLPIIEEPIYQCILISPESEMEKLRELFPECQFTRSNPYTVDIIPKGGSKIVGIQKVAEHFGFDIKEVMAFGDSSNDVEMLSSVGIGVAMGNASDDIKELADYTTKSHTDHGIFHALKHFKIIKK